MPSREPEASERLSGSEPPRVWVPPLAAVLARWPWLLAVGLMLALLSALAPVSGLSAATATMQITGSYPDSLRAKQIGQTVERAVKSEPVMAEAARARNVTAKNLASRVTAQWLEDTDLIMITVSGSDADGVVKDADSVADAVVAVNAQEAQSQLKQIQKESNRLLTSGNLADTRAEAARRTQLGSNVGIRTSDSPPRSKITESQLAAAISAPNLRRHSPRK